MNHRAFNVASERKFYRASAICLLVALASASGTAAQNAVPADFQGRWVPSKATCDSPVVVLVAAGRLTLVNGKDSEALGGIEMAGPGYFPPDYRGIMAVLITEFSGHQPVTVTFNMGEKKGVAQVDFAPVQPGTPTAQAAEGVQRAYLEAQSCQAILPKQRTAQEVPGRIGRGRRASKIVFS